MTTLVSREISCEGCANAIKNSVGKLPGIQKVEVDVAGQEVRVQHDEAITSREAITAAMDRAGFPVERL